LDVPEGHLVEIPVRYGGTYGPDLVDVAAHSGLSIEAVIELHVQPVYTVAMLGFAPGFAYLLGLPETLATPRLATPRLRVPPGSVGIADAQTGVYALKTPGGWRIIGRTDLALFDPARESPFTLQAGDRVRFIPL
jgi:KipI family sensor histidine kinase inhibitor